MRWPVLAALLVLAVGCGDSSGPVPPANIQFVGTLNRTFCLLGLCEVRGEGRNVGEGCAKDIRGFVRIFRSSDDEQVGVAEFEHDGLVRPQGSFIYTALMPEDAWSITHGYYRTEATWRDVRC